MKKVIYLLSFLTLFSCEKLDFETENGVDVTFTVQGTRSEVNLKDQVSKASWRIFKKQGDGTYIAAYSSEHQDTTDSDFGTYSVLLEEGCTFKLVMLGYDGDGNCTISSPTSVTFKSSQIYDTYCYVSEDIIIDEPKSITIQPKRCVSKIKVYPTDSSKMYDFDKMFFKYTGGSSTLNPSTGLGCVASTQKVYRTKDAFKIHDNDTIPSFELYTIPLDSHSDRKTETTYHELDTTYLKLTISALDSYGNAIDNDETIFESIPVIRNNVTEVYGKLYSKYKLQSAEIKVDPSWAGTNTKYIE